LNAPPPGISAACDHGSSGPSIVIYRVYVYAFSCRQSVIECTCMLSAAAGTSRGAALVVACHAESCEVKHLLRLVRPNRA
jgi:hypothetical protein